MNKNSTNSIKGRFYNAVTDDERNLIISFAVSGSDTYQAKECVNKIKAWKKEGKETLAIELDIARKKRSLDANAYAWVLIDKIAKAVSIGKTDVYKAAIKDIGGVSETICVKKEAAERLCGAWDSNGIGWQSETMPSKINGCVNVVLYYGSSVYDTKQMTSLIDYLVCEAEELGIDTKTPEETAKMLNLWGG